MKTLVVALLVLAGLAALWLRYGTLSPCEMLKHDLRAALVTVPPGEDALQRWGRALGTTLLEPALGAATERRSAARCARDVVRLHTGTPPEDVLTEALMESR
jgi:hypothetical protein